MSLFKVNLHPSRGQRRVFAAAWLVCAAIVGWLQWRHGRPAAAGMVWSAGAIGPLLEVLWPEALRRLYVGLSFATYPIGLAVSSLVLAVLYYAVLTPIGLGLRLCRHDALQRRFVRRAGSYWQARPPPPDSDSYFRQH